MLLATLLHLLLLRAYFVILGAGTDLSYLSEILGPSQLTAHYGRYPSFVCLHTARVVQTGSYQPFKAVVVAIPRT